MNSSEYYSPLPSSIQARQLIKYLKSYHWSMIDLPDITDIIVFRKLFGDKEEEIVVPNDLNFADYSVRILDVIHSLSKFENRNLNDIIEDLLTFSSDILRIKISGGNVGSGKISFLDEMTIKDGLKKVLSSAACQVLDPKPFYKKLHRTEAEQLLRNCQLGQPEQGSYIIKFYFPVLDAPGASMEKNKPFARQVAEHFMISLKNIVSAIQEENFQLIPKLNANLCFGLVEMPGDSRVDLNFQMSWSEEIPTNINTPREVIVYNNYMPAISKIGEVLRPQEGSTESDFIGKISTLSGSENEQGTIEGDVILSLFVDEDIKKAKALLPSKFYSEACDAHKKGNYVKVSGLLREKPRMSLLENICLFEVIPK